MLEAFHDGKILSPATYTFSDGPRRGESYEITWRVCQNPFCHCRQLNVVFQATAATPETVVSIDFAEGEVEIPDDDPRASAFAEDFDEDLSEDEWNDLAGIFYALKRRITREADLTLDEAVFQHEEVEEGLMVPYRDILPFADPIVVELDGREFLAKDQYCLRPRCDCRSLNLQFAPLDLSPEEDVPELGPLAPLAVTLDLKTRQWKLEGRGDFDVSVRELMAALLARRSVLAELRKRRSTLRALYKGFLRRTRPETRTEPKVSSPSVKIGRNEPCPCGSGMKYKKCCMGKDSREASKVDEVPRALDVGEPDAAR